MAAIELHDLRKSYPGATAPSVRDISLDLPERAFAVILGPSGCGKSTMLRMIAGLESITAGEVRVAGERVNEREPKDRHCAMVFQNYALYPHMTVAANIGYPLKVAGVRRAERDRRVREIATTLALDTLLDRKPGQLSGGQRQRVAMGRAMVRNPRVFLFDEPLSNLDATLRTQMRVELRRLHDRLGATSILVTHDQVEAMTLADILVVMNAGCVEQVGDPRAVYDRPATRYVAGFLGAPAMNLLDGRVSGDGMHVTLGEGLVLPLPARFEPGHAVTVGIRPEHVGEGALEARCELTENLGTSQLVHARLHGCTILLHRPPEEAVGRGQPVMLSLPPQRLHLFDAATGARMEPETVGAPVRAYALA